MTKSKKVLGKGGSNRKSGDGMGGGRGGGGRYQCSKRCFI